MFQNAKQIKKNLNVDFSVLKYKVKLIDEQSRWSSAQMRPESQCERMHLMSLFWIASISVLYSRGRLHNLQCVYLLSISSEEPNQNPLWMHFPWD